MVISRWIATVGVLAWLGSSSMFADWSIWAVEPQQAPGAYSADLDVALPAQKGMVLKNVLSSGNSIPQEWLNVQLRLEVESTNDPNILPSGTRISVSFLNDEVVLSFFPREGAHQEYLLKVTQYTIQGGSSVLFSLDFIERKGHTLHLKLSPDSDEGLRGSFNVVNVPDKTAPAVLTFETLSGQYRYIHS